MSSTRDLLNEIRDFDDSPESVGFDLRQDLVEIILRQLDGKRWTQSSLAAAAGMKSSFLSRIIHAQQNCTLDVAGRLLFALGLRGKLVPADADGKVLISPSMVFETSAWIGETNAQETEAEVKFGARQISNGPVVFCTAG